MISGCCSSEIEKTPLQKKTLNHELVNDIEENTKESDKKNKTKKKKALLKKYKSRIYTLLNSRKYKQAEKYYRKLINSKLPGIDKDIQLIYFDAMFAYLHKNYEISADLCSKILKMKPDFKLALRLRKKAILKLEQIRKQQKRDHYYSEIPVIKKILSCRNSDFVLIWDTEKILQQCDISLFKALMPDYVKLVEDTVTSLGKLTGIEKSISGGCVGMRNDDTAIFALCSTEKISLKKIMDKFIVNNPDIDVYDLTSSRNHPQIQIGQLHMAVLSEKNILFGSDKIVQEILFSYGRDKEFYLKTDIGVDMYTLQGEVDFSADRFNGMDFIDQGLMKINISEREMTARYYYSGNDSKIVKKYFSRFDYYLDSIVRDVIVLGKSGFHFGKEDFSDKFPLLRNIIGKRKKNLMKDGFSVRMVAGKEISMITAVSLALFCKKQGIDFYFKNRELQRCQEVLFYLDEGLEAFSQSKGFVPRNFIYVIRNADIDPVMMVCPSGVPDTYYINDSGCACCKIHGSIENPIYKK